METGLSPRILIATIVAPAVVLLVSFARTSAHPRPALPHTQQRARVPFRVPTETELTDSVFRRSALRGRAILLATRDSLPRNTGNSLRCASCHLDGGLRRDAMPWVGSFARFPQYRPRSGKVDLIEDRINDCFERSMNGSRLNPAGRDMHDIVAYLAFLSKGMPIGVEMEGQGFPRLTPMSGNPERGLAVFTTTCTRCHGADGQGTQIAPPLWGRHSYNVGAGMARISTAASFVYGLMPIDRAQQLSPQQAFDVAAYINTRPRPDFPRKVYDWPHGGKPPDADYHVLPPVTKQEKRK